MIKVAFEYVMEGKYIVNMVNGDEERSLYARLYKTVKMSLVPWVGLDIAFDFGKDFFGTFRVKSIKHWYEGDNSLTVILETKNDFNSKKPFDDMLKVMTKHGWKQS